LFERLRVRNWWRHILVIAVLGVYLISANALYVRFILKQGKPILAGGQPPAEQGNVYYKLGEMRPVRVDGEDLYELKGFAFNADDPQSDHSITVVLISGQGRLDYATTLPAFPNMIRSSKSFKPGMDDAEFRALISKRALPPGSYRVGLLLQKKYSDETLFVITGSTLSKTPNNVRFQLAKTK
jgi:hypothetical protein